MMGRSPSSRQGSLARRDGTGSVLFRDGRAQALLETDSMSLQTSSVPATVLHWDSAEPVAGRRAVATACLHDEGSYAQARSGDIL